MLALDEQQQSARDWFESLRDRICASFEAIEREAGSDATFVYTPWDRIDPSGEPGGGGVRGVMKGKVFEKVGVNVSTVHGTFARILGPWRREGLMSLGDAVRKLSALPASNLGITDRGRLAPGFHADIVLFDPATVADMKPVWRGPGSILYKTKP